MGAVFQKKISPLDTYKPTCTDNNDAGEYLDWIAHPKLSLNGWSNIKKHVKNYRNLKPLDFDFKCVLGRGTIGTVFLVKLKSDGKYYAVKSIRRSSIVHRRNADKIKRELKILNMLRKCVFVAHIFAAFQDEKHVCYLLEYGFGGELYTLIHSNKKYGKLNEGAVLFYAAEIACALNHLHDLKIAFRDLKPDNIVIDERGHIRLVDFGLALFVDDDGYVDNPSSSGTAEYLAPEITRGFKEPHGIQVDWWALGIVIYEMLYSRLPFGERPSTSKYEIFMNINAVKYKFPRRSNISSNIKDLIKGLLTKNVTNRFTFQNMLSHSSFQNINNMHKINNFQLCPPIIPGDATKNSGKSGRMKKILIGDHSNFKKWKEPRYKKKKPLTTAELQYTNIAGSSSTIQ
jgi:protein-serine/threonine kinase